MNKDTYICLPHAELPASDPCSTSNEYKVLLKSIAKDVDELKKTSLEAGGRGEAWR